MRNTCFTYHRREIRLIEGNWKCRHLKNLPVKGLCGRCLSVWSPEPHTPSPPLHTVYVSCIQYTHSHTEEGEGGELTREKVKGATVHKAGSKIPTWLTVSPIYKQTKSLCRSNFFRWRHFALDIVNWSMLTTMSGWEWKHPDTTMASLGPPDHIKGTRLPRSACHSRITDN